MHRQLLQAVDHAQWALFQEEVVEDEPVQAADAQLLACANEHDDVFFLLERNLGMHVHVGDGALIDLAHELADVGAVLQVVYQRAFIQLDVQHRLDPPPHRQLGPQEPRGVALLLLQLPHNCVDIIRNICFLFEQASEIGLALRFWRRLSPALGSVDLAQVLAEVHVLLLHGGRGQAVALRPVRHARLPQVLAEVQLRRVLLAALDGVV
mmetsp:Transcript_48550/g.122193  ORF Transcript_48550/g.122193 Transcript_48550/m.122193 type:complete len:209 (-) Transcript_48550:720-1346(-)